MTNVPHDCGTDICNVINRLTQPEICLATTDQSCTVCEGDGTICTFQTRDAETCNQCIQWCTTCGASPLTQPSACAYNHAVHTFSLEMYMEDIVINQCDQCRAVDRRCNGSRYGCRCNTTTQHHHCPIHHDQEDFQVSFSGNNRCCDACRRQHATERQQDPMKQQREKRLHSQGRSLAGAKTRVLPLKEEQNLSKQLDWCYAMDHLNAVVTHLQEKDPHRLPLSTNDMKKLYKAKTKYLGNNNSFGYEPVVVVEKMFQWLLGNDKTIKRSTVLRELPWNDPRS